MTQPLRFVGGTMHAIAVGLIALLGVLVLAMAFTGVFGGCEDKRHALPTTSKLLRCPVCNHDLASDSTQCMHCGHNTIKDWNTFDRSLEPKP
jgi:hypothetical protein